MSVTIIDRRVNSRDKSTENRSRFLRRIKETIKEQLPGIINGRSIKDIDSTGGKIKVSRKTITEPTIHHVDGGNVDRVIPGNDEYVEGDMIPKPSGDGRGRGGSPSDTGKSEDDFVIELSREEFLEAFFDGLELPDMVKTQITKIKETKRENAGFQPDGSPNRLNVVRSYKQSFARRLTVIGSIKKQLEELEAQLFLLKLELAKSGNEITADERQALELMVAEIEAKIEKFVHRMSHLPMFEEMDMRYRTVVHRDIPVAHATMVMIMDNSGSMGEKEKTIARKFFWLLYSFLRRVYEKVDMVFISHTTEATEMDEEEFFNTHESGGTIVSSALDLTATIIKERLLNKTNIYVAQVSDGDNFDTDNGNCSEILDDDILPFVRYFAYVQVDDYHDDTTTASHFGLSPTSLLSSEKGLWRTYQSVSSRNSKLQAKRVFQESDIYPVFRELFAKKVK